MTTTRSKNTLVKFLEAVRPEHECSFEMIRKSGKVTGIPEWKCNCGKVVKAN